MRRDFGVKGCTVRPSYMDEFKAMYKAAGLHALPGTMRILIFTLCTARHKEHMTCVHHWNEIGKSSHTGICQSDVCTLFSSCFQALTFTGPT